MASAGPPIILTVLMIVTLLAENLITISNGSSISQQNFTGVEIPGGLHMEIVEEETCSNRVIRLTCRSLRAFLLVLDAGYQKNRFDLCDYDSQRRKKKLKDLKKKSKYLRGNYIDDDSIEEFADLRISLNRRCSGLQHCRFNVNSHHPEAAFWTPANIRIKYACIPEAAIGKYCNTKISVLGGEGGYLKSPGYPHYYLGGSTCGWTFESQPGQRISLTLHDLNIRNPDQDGSCIDVIRVRENGITLLETCGTSAGLQVLSESNLITLDLIALGNLYPSRGFFLQYRAIGCPEGLKPPKGSYLVNDTSEVKGFLCKAGTVFPDTLIRSRSIRCKNGMWSEDTILHSCVDSSAAILKAERETGRYSSLSEDTGTIYIPPNGIVERSSDAMTPSSSLDKSSMGQQGDYVVDIILPSLFIALLFIGNAIIVYIIFQYRKRKQPSIGGRRRGEEMALREKSAEDFA